MPIKYIDEDNDPICFGSTWTEQNRKQLVVNIANLLCGFYETVARNIDDGTVDNKTRKHHNKYVIKKLNSPLTDHRDGWLFQMISFLCLLKKHSTKNNYFIAHPHIQPADKGFDNLLLKIDDNLKQIEYIMLTEDKATKTPRKLFRTQVLPEFKAIEEDERTEQLITCTTALLKETSLNREEREEEIERFFWERDEPKEDNILRYRANLTVPVKRKYSKLFKDYEKTVKGMKIRRRGEMFKVDNMRVWMQNLSNEIIKHIEN